MGILGFHERNFVRKRAGDRVLGFPHYGTGTVSRIFRMTSSLVISSASAS